MSPGGSVNTTTVALTVLHTRNAVTERATLTEWPTLPALPLNNHHRVHAIPVLHVIQRITQMCPLFAHRYLYNLPGDPDTGMLIK